MCQMVRVNGIQHPFHRVLNETITQCVAYIIIYFSCVSVFFVCLLVYLFMFTFAVADVATLFNSSSYVEYVRVKRDLMETRKEIETIAWHQYPYKWYVVCTEFSCFYIIHIGVIGDWVAILHSTSTDLAFSHEENEHL